MLEELTKINGRFVKMLGNQVLAEWLPQERRGALFTPESAVDFISAPDPKLYRALAVGPGRKLKNGTLVPIEIRPGERILVGDMPTHGPVETEFGDRIKIINAADVLAVFPPQ